MIEKDISKHILTISQDYLPPLGGIAQVVYSYDKYVFENCKTLRIKKGSNVWIGRFFIITSILKLIALLLFDRNIKIVHIHTASYNRFYFNTFYSRIAKFFKKKVIMHIHGGGFAEYYNTNPKWIKSKLLECDVVVALTNSWKLFFENTVGCNNVVQIDNIVEPPQYIQTKTDSGCKHFLFLGKVCREKGVFDLLEVINEKKNELNGKMVLHVGGGGEIEKLKKYIEENSLENIVKFEGWVSGDKKISLLNSCDTYILPSYAEGLPISILEALSYGHYILSTNVGGIPEIITCKDEGILITPGDKQALYSSIKHIIEDKEIINTRTIRITKALKHQPENISKVLTAIYQKLL